MKSFCHCIMMTVSFNLIYFSCVQCRCEGDHKTLTNWTGVIESPNFKKGRYSPNQDCTWHIQMPPGYGLKLNFLNFTLGDGMTVHSSIHSSINDIAVDNTSCTDYVSIRDVDISSQKYCGDLLPPEFKSNYSDVYVDFHSDKDVDPSVFRGFRIAYTWICASRLIQVPDEGVFTLEPPPPFSKETSCKWTVSAKDERSLALHQNYQGTSTPSGWQVCTASCVPLENYSEWFYPGVNISLVWQPMETQSTRVAVFFTSLVKSHPCITTKDKCQHNGICVADGDSYRCNCTRYFTGTNCETERNPCSSDPCKNGGTCKFGTNSQAFCQCVGVYHGDYCENIDVCVSSPCQRGQCRSNGSRYNCDCPPGYSGDYCENIDVCVSNPCQRGQCRSNGSRYNCDCPPGYRGNTCSKVVDTIFCQEGSANYFALGMHWKDTRIGDEDIQPCPFGAKGNARRFCYQRKGISDSAFWDQMDLSDCVRTKFTELSQAAEAFRSQQSISKTSILNITSSLIAEITSNDNDVDVQLLPGDLSSAADTVRTIADVIHKTEGSMEDIREIAQGYGDTVGSLIDNNTARIWNFTKSGFLERKIKELLQSTETLSRNIASHVIGSLERHRREADDNKNFTVPVISKNVEFAVSILSKEDAVHESSFEGTSPSSSRIIIPKDVNRLAKENTNGSYVSHYEARFSSVAEVVMETRRWLYMSSSEAPMLNSDVISFKVLDVPDSYFQDLQSPVVIIFKLDNSTLRSNMEPLCVFLNMSSMNNRNQWSTSGCNTSIKDSNFTHTVCHCYHLTYFAVIMDVYDIKNTIQEININILTYISYAGGGLSVLCCVISIVVFEFFRLRTARIRVHEQLALCIVAVQLLFLFGIDRAENRGVCMGIAIALHFFLLALFCWMLVEGIHLYMLLVKVFNSSSHLKKYMMLGWGIPIVVVGISGGVFYEDYGTRDICWLTPKMILMMIVPAVGLVILINTVILLIVLRMMIRSMTHGSKVTLKERSTIRVGLKAAAVLLPILGFTWIFGFLSVTGKETLVFTYLFTFFNSLQGVFFFVFHCLLSTDVKNAYDRRRKRLRHIKPTESSLSKNNERTNSDIDLSGYSTSKGSFDSVLTDTPNLDRKCSIGKRHEQFPVTGQGRNNIIWTAVNGLSEVTCKPTACLDEDLFLKDSHVRRIKNSSDIIRTPADTHETKSRLEGHVISYNPTPLSKRSDGGSFYVPSFHAAIIGHDAEDAAYGSDRYFK